MASIVYWATLWQAQNPKYDIAGAHSWSHFCAITKPSLDFLWWLASLACQNLLLGFIGYPRREQIACDKDWCLLKCNKELWAGSLHSKIKQRKACYVPRWRLEDLRPRSDFETLLCRAICWLVRYLHSSLSAREIQRPLGFASFLKSCYSLIACKHQDMSVRWFLTGRHSLQRYL